MNHTKHSRRRSDKTDCIHCRRPLPTRLVKLEPPAPEDHPAWEWLELFHDAHCPWLHTRAGQR